MFRGCNHLVVIHVIRFQWFDNHLSNATYYIKKGKQINLYCSVSPSAGTHACIPEHPSMKSTGAISDPPGF